LSASLLVRTVGSEIRPYRSGPVECESAYSNGRLGGPAQPVWPGQEQLARRSREEGEMLKVET